MQLSWDYVLQPLLNICGGHGLAQRMEPDVVDWLGCVAIKRTTDIKCPKKVSSVDICELSFDGTAW